VPTSAVVLAGVVAVLGAAGLLWVTARLRREVDATRRMLRRVHAAADEVEHVDRARRRLTGGPSFARQSATGAGRAVLRSGQAIAGIPYAILDSIGRRRPGRDESP
jgi:hypothetical protein